MSKWIGYAVSVNCGEPLGCYQGTILEADGNTVTLTKAFRNGFPYPKSQVTLNAADIKQLRIIEERPPPAETPRSTVAVAKAAKKPQRATVCENLQANPSSSGSGGSNSGSTPKGQRGGAAGGGGGGGGGGGPGAAARRRNEACFGERASPSLGEFDFEGNLALFDKRKLWEQMNATKPDLVRTADDERKYRHDQNVLGGAGGGARRAIRVPDELRGPLDYVTDDAVCVPSVTPRLRRQLWEGMQRYGLLESAHTLEARALCDVALRLVGGGRRLEARNAHQAPVVCALVAPHATGAAGLMAGRLLAAHAVHVAAYVAPGASGATCASLQREMSALALSGIELAPRLDALPRPDLVLLALHDPLDASTDDVHAQHAHALAPLLAWAVSARAPLVVLEPPHAGWPGVTARAAVTALLPCALAPSLGRVYLCAVGAPSRLFAELRVNYRPPFGACALLALHPNDE